MNLKTKSAEQLRKMIRRGIEGGARSAALEWAERIESEHARCALPKKKQRQLGLLPALQDGMRAL